MNPHWSDGENRMAKDIARAGRGRLHSPGKHVAIASPPAPAWTAPPGAPGPESGTGQ
jgi:hypothetical protein